MWRAGAHKILYHVHVLAAAIDVVMVRPPHDRWVPITTEQAARRAGKRPGAPLGVLMGDQRKRLGHSAEALAELAVVSADDIRRLEAGHGLPDATLMAICDALDLDVAVLRRRR